MNKPIFTHEIRGYLVGPIWMPATECYKPLRYQLTNEDARFNEPLTLREHVLRATNDGNFQYCQIADGELVTTAYITKETRNYRRSVSRPLSAFPSIADCVKTDWDGPMGDE